MQTLQSALIVALMSLAFAQASDADKKLERQATTGYSAMIASIETLECKVERTRIMNGKKEVVIGEYARQGEREKWSVKAPPGKVTNEASEMIFSQSGIELQSLMRNRGQKGAATDSGEINRRISITDEGWGADVWGILGFRRQVHASAATAKLKESERYGWGKAKIINDAGDQRHKGIRLSTESSVPGENSGSILKSYDYDQDCNFLLVTEESRMELKQTQSVRRWTWGKVKEVEPGIFIPTEIVETIANGKGAEQKSIFVLSDVKINHKVADVAVTFQFPKGSKVRDLIRGVEYTAGADGKADGPIRELPKSLSPPSGK